MSTHVYAYHRVRDPSAHEKKHPACAYPVPCVDSVPGRRQHTAASLASTRATHLHSLRKPDNLKASLHRKIGTRHPKHGLSGPKERACRRWVRYADGRKVSHGAAVSVWVGGWVRSGGSPGNGKSTVGTASRRSTLV